MEQQVREVNGSLAIVGGGAAAVALIAALARGKVRPRKVMVFEKTPAQLATGLAYTERSETHLLNVPASKMGISGESEGEFFAWLQANGHSYSEDAFVPRFLYGRYLREILEKESKGLPQVDLIPSEVIDCIEDGSGRTKLITREQSYLSEYVVFALGNHPHRVQSVAQDSTTVGVWDVTPDMLPQKGTVVILGAGLSALDILFDLQAKNFQGKIVLVSRTGRLPYSHKKIAHSWSAAEQLLGDLAQLNSLPEIEKRIRTEISKAPQAWKSIIDSLRPVSPLLWRRITVRERKRFLRHLSRLWEVSRHRCPEEALQLVETLSAQERLEIVPGRAVKIITEESGEKEILLNCGSERPHRTIKNVKLLVDATGFAAFPSSQSSELLHALVERELLMKDSTGIGVWVGEFGRVMLPEGKVHERHFFMGGLRRGSDFEATAVREIRQQAVDIVRLLQASRA